MIFIFSGRSIITAAQSLSALISARANEGREVIVNIQHVNIYNKIVILIFFIILIY